MVSLTPITFVVTALIAFCTSRAAYSPACSPKYKGNINRIFFRFMRKSAGTTTFHYLKKVSENLGLEFKSQEAGLKTPRPAPNSSTFFVTNIREPVSRAISHYKYDQRWSCKNLMNKSWVPTENNIESRLEDFIHNPFGKKNPKRALEKLLGCAINCYAQWATGKRIIPSQMANFTDDLLTEASQVLFSYDLIIVQEWLQDPQYVKNIEHFFQTPGLKNRRMYCGDSSHKANKKIPLIIQNETMNSLKVKNQVDIMLYNELTSCPTGAKFSNRTIFQRSEPSSQRAAKRKGGKMLRMLEKESQRRKHNRQPPLNYSITEHGIWFDSAFYHYGSHYKLLRNLLEKLQKINGVEAVQLRKSSKVLRNWLH
jgi:hypothetical protein